MGPGTQSEKPCLRAILLKRPAYSSTWVWCKHGNINLLWYTERLLIHKHLLLFSAGKYPIIPKVPPNTFIKNRPGLNKSTVDCDIGQWSPKGRDNLSVQNKVADPVLAELSPWQLHLLTKPAVCTAAAQTHRMRLLIVRHWQNQAWCVWGPAVSGVAVDPLSTH